MQLVPQVKCKVHVIEDTVKPSLICIIVISRRKNQHRLWGEITSSSYRNDIFLFIQVKHAHR